MRKQLPEWLPRVLVESALIVFSVLLALIVNEWRQSVAQHQRVEQALAGISSELHENQRLVTEALEYHTRIAASFSASARDGAEMPDMRVITQGILAPARVLRTAWDAAQNTGIVSHLPYPMVLQLSSVYARQEEYEGLSHALVQTATDRVMREGFDSLIRQYPNFIMVQREFAARERVLLEHYSEVLDHLR